MTPFRDEDLAARVAALREERVALAARLDGVRNKVRVLEPWSGAASSWGWGYRSAGCS